MRTLSDTAEILSPPELAQSGTKFSGAMRVVRGFVRGPKYEAIIDDLQAALSVSRRTAQRIYAGQDVNAPATFAVLTHADLGAPLLTEILSRIEPARRIAAASALRDACDLARMKAEQEELIKRMDARVKR
jgi:hypothetical protein